MSGFISSQVWTSGPVIVRQNLVPASISLVVGHQVLVYTREPETFGGTLKRKVTTDGSIVILDTATGEEFPI